LLLHLLLPLQTAPTNVQQAAARAFNPGTTPSTRGKKSTYAAKSRSNPALTPTRQERRQI